MNDPEDDDTKDDMMIMKMTLKMVEAYGKFY